MKRSKLVFFFAILFSFLVSVAFGETRPMLIVKNLKDEKRVIKKKGGIKALEVKKMIKPKEADLQWDKIIVGQQQIDGATILGVPKDSVLRRMDLRQGDIIIRINDTSLHSQEDLNSAVKKINKTESTLTLEIIRLNEKILLDYKLHW
jgi:S1-C subfamily serine protease